MTRRRSLPPASFVRAFTVIAALCVWLAPAQAQEVFAGVYAHGVETPLTFDTGEHGVDLSAGYRFAPIETLRSIGAPEPYVLVNASTSGETSFAAAGLSWTLGKGPVYVRPGIGIAIHDGPKLRVDPATRLRTDLGSRVLFEPEIAVGTRVNDRISVEASWMHVSHAQLFSGQNPGLDIMGVRVAYRLP